VDDFLVTYLDTIDERLLEYLDDDEELRLDAVRRLRLYTSALLDGSVTPESLADDWPDWFHLAPAFVAAYGTDELAGLENAPVFLRADGEEDVHLVDADRAYLRALEVQLDMYPEMRTTDE
jgi:hypothetical protein